MIIFELINGISANLSKFLPVMVYPFNHGHPPIYLRKLEDHVRQCN